MHLVLFWLRHICVSWLYCRSNGQIDRQSGKRRLWTGVSSVSGSHLNASLCSRLVHLVLFHVDHARIRFGGKQRTWSFFSLQLLSWMGSRIKKMIKLFIVEQMGGFEAVITGLMDEFRIKSIKRETFTALAIFCSFLISLVNVTQASVMQLLVEACVQEAVTQNLIQFVRHFLLLSHRPLSREAVIQCCGSTHIRPVSLCCALHSSKRPLSSTFTEWIVFAKTFDPWSAFVRPCSGKYAGNTFHRFFFWSVD